MLTCVMLISGILVCVIGSLHDSCLRDACSVSLRVMPARCRLRYAYFGYGSLRDAVCAMPACVIWLLALCQFILCLSAVWLFALCVSVLWLLRLSHGCLRDAFMRYMQYLPH